MYNNRDWRPLGKLSQKTTISISYDARVQSAGIYYACTSLTSLLSRGFLLKALVFPPFLGSPIPAAPYTLWSKNEERRRSLVWARLDLWFERCSTANWYLWPPPLLLAGWMVGALARTHGHIWGSQRNVLTWQDLRHIQGFTEQLKRKENV